MSGNLKGKSKGKGKQGHEHPRRNAALSLAIALILSCSILSLTSCHGTVGQAPFKVPETFDTSRNYSITFWAKNDTNKTQSDIYAKAIEDFQALYPNVTVNLRLYTDYGRIYNDVITNIPTGTTPNVCITYPDHIATYMSGVNTVVPLDDLFTDPKYGLGGSEVLFEGPSLSELSGKFLDECILGSGHYAIPFVRSTEACYVNVTMLNALGYEMPDELSWDFIWEASEKAALKGEDGRFLVNGQTVMLPFVYKSTDNMMIQILRQRNAPYSGQAGTIGLFGEATANFLYEIATHTASGAFYTFAYSGYPANFLNAGQCLFAIDSTAGATWMGQNAPLSDLHKDQIAVFDTEVRRIPQVDPDNPSMISQGPSVCLFNKDDPQEVLASWLFASYLLTDEVQISYAQTEGYIPVTSKAQNSQRYQDYLSRSGEDNDLHYDIKIKASQILLENIGNTFVTPVFNGSISLRNAAGQLIENVVKSVKRKETIDANYMQKLFSNVISLYRLDQISMGGGSAASRMDFGPLPIQARVLIASLVGVWICLGVGAAVSMSKRKRSKAESGRQRGTSPGN